MGAGLAPGWSGSGSVLLPLRLLASQTQGVQNDGAFAVAVSLCLCIVLALETLH